MSLCDEIWLDDHAVIGKPYELQEDYISKAVEE
jgi:hypothetical protein